MSSVYRQYEVESYLAYGEPSEHRVRVRPCAGQGLDTNMNVRCSVKMRDQHPVGTRFKLRAKLTSMKDGRPFLHAPYSWPYEVVASRGGKGVSATALRRAEDVSANKQRPRQQQVAYDPTLVSIEKLAISGTRVERVHGEEYVVTPRFYSVCDRNLSRKGAWLLELYEKLLSRAHGDDQRVTIVTAALAPADSPPRMASLTRQSIMIVPGMLGKYRGMPYAHVSFREAQSFGGRRTAVRGGKDVLPEWFLERYSRRLRLRKTVQGRVQSDHKAVKHLTKYHDNKQVVVFDAWDDEQFIRLFLLTRIYAADKGFKLASVD